MKNTITLSNFDSYKIAIINACSCFGAINRPNTWFSSLNIFQFECESVRDMATSLLFNEYERQIEDIKTDT
jgi:hypothetical protein